jgi:hypothetical protein
MSKSKLFLLTILAGLFVMAGCEYDEIPLPKEPDPTIEYSFSKEIMPIFNKACNGAGCHNAGGIPPDLSPANAYKALISGNYINTNKPEDSELYQWMKGNKRIPMPLEGPNAAWNALVLAWITQGAKDN